MSIWQIFDKGLVGLDIGVSGIKAVEISPGKNRRLMAYNRIPLPWNTISPDGEIRNRDVVVDALRALFGSKEFTTKKVATAAFGNSIITKKIQVPRMKEADLQEQIYWEAEQYIPFDVNDVNLDFAILNTANTAAPGKMDVLLVAAKKDYVQSIHDTLERAGLIVEAIDTQSFALGNAFEYNYSHIVDTELATCVLVDFGAGSTKVSVFEKDKTTFHRELRQCGIACSLMLSERLGVSLDEAEKIKIEDFANEKVGPIIAEFNHLVCEEVSRSIDFSITQTADTALDSVYVCGGASLTHGLIETLGTKLSVPVRKLNPVQSISGSGKQMNAQVIREMTYLSAVAVGLGLRTGGDR